MNTAEKVLEEVRTLPEFELREVLDFVGFLKARHGISASVPAADVTADPSMLEQLARAPITAPTKAPDLALMNEVRGKVRTDVVWTREELYDRGLR